MTLDQCRLIELPKFEDERGCLSFVEGSNHIPFPIARVFYIYGVPTGSARGAHAHYDLHQFLICMSGALTVDVDDGTQRTSFRMDRPSVGLHIPPMIWASERDFAPGAVYLVLASAPFKAESYIRDYDQYLKARGVRR